VVDLKSCAGSTGRFEGSVARCKAGNPKFSTLYKNLMVESEIHIWDQKMSAREKMK
jgi:hypothetical protein